MVLKSMIVEYGCTNLGLGGLGDYGDNMVRSKVVITIKGTIKSFEDVDKIQLPLGIKNILNNALIVDRKEWKKMVV